jgi:hypothetical protein
MRDSFCRIKNPFGDMLSVPDHPANEAERLLALHKAALIDTQPEERFDRITRLGAHFFGV